ncbi:hypothetical protein Pcinc_027566 [Petrolisthes cinctipes]|uniref:Uncharacterized protein n=1 Tax=Petrolisthes cinctipes TaxID=88211 RepID=A0AAE1F4X0_PETCI|nr:hypothetical protein Pcinc_027566 [Petrolisthes cinctipes]
MFDNLRMKTDTQQELHALEEENQNEIEELSPLHHHHPCQIYLFSLLILIHSLQHFVGILLLCSRVYFLNSNIFKTLDSLCSCECGGLGLYLTELQGSPGVVMSDKGEAQVAATMPTQTSLAWMMVVRTHWVRRPHLSVLVLLCWVFVFMRRWSYTH